ncbi:epidermal growth factor receptor kinase substrate 8-like protein 3 [Scomber japonicus]|uniref:epidermal growth factor receptor kinase substrate 8-like protein 3 n=1 Tax=Scomber japonicus TaxID=13676 RepID=UPI002305E465|nr:epidermal growth factor receptor kinase substrate 8-like protein 3 [Scomber japonicus]
MPRSNSPFFNDTSSYAESIQSNGYSMFDEASSQLSSMSRPSAKSIYMQRQDYSVSVNKMLNKRRFRVEHLFTCDLDGKEIRCVADCVERLKLLDEMGRVWGQNMLMEVRGATLLLTDTDTKEELDSIALSDIQEVKALLDAAVFNSLLTLLVQPRERKPTRVFMFQCEDVGADFVQRELSQVLSHRREDASSSNAGLEGMKNHHKAATPEPRTVPLWTSPDYETDVLEPELAVPPDEEEEEEEEEEAPPSRLGVSTPSPFTTAPPERPYTELDRNVDILNHIVTDVEIFMGQVAAVAAKNTKKKKKKKKGKAMDGMPPAGEFAACLHKIKSGFNLLGELNGKINNPSVPELVHSFFSTLSFVVSHSPDDLPQTIVAPLLTPQCIRLLSEEASTEEDNLWQSLGDAWNIPSTKWPEDDEDIPTYTLEFSDGWQPPELRAAPAPREPVRRQEVQKPTTSQTPAKRATTPPSQTALYARPHKPRNEPKLRHVKVTNDFISRNHRELTVRKGDIVVLLDTSKQWWKVRNSGGEEGYVPNNVLDVDGKQPDEEVEGTPVLTRRSKSADVKAWLEDKGFSKITVRCLGMLSGSMLLGMSREELKQVCPEEGGRVFYQLQAVKSALALAN